MPTNPYSPDAIRSLFDEMSATYGFVNLIASFGFAALWRHQLVRGLPLSQAQDIIDLMSGMSELCHPASRHLSPRARVTGIDLSPEMIRRARRNWPFALDLKLADVLTHDFEPASADLVISSFGLKTFDDCQQARLAQVVARLLRPGGTFAFVEISVPPSRLLRLPYMFYLKRLIPLVGKLCLGNPDNYRMLGFYTQAFADARPFAHHLRAQGLQVTDTTFFFGCATGARGTKPLQ